MFVEGLFPLLVRGEGGDGGDSSQTSFLEILGIEPRYSFLVSKMT